MVNMRDRQCKLLSRFNRQREKHVAFPAAMPRTVVFRALAPPTVSEPNCLPPRELRRLSDANFAAIGECANTVLFCVGHYALFRRTRMMYSIAHSDGQIHIDNTAGTYHQSRFMPGYLSDSGERSQPSTWVKSSTRQCGQTVRFAPPFRFRTPVSRSDWSLRACRHK